MSLNVVILRGNLVKAAELSYWQNQTPYCNFSIGNNESYKDQNGEWQSIASYFDCQVKGKYAEAIAKELVKGRGVEVQGRLKQQRWEKDGVKLSRVIINVEHIYFLPTGQSNGATYNNGYQNQPVQNKPMQTFEPLSANDDFEPEFNMPEDIPF